MKKRMEQIAKNLNAIGIAGILLSVLVVGGFVSMSAAKPQPSKVQDIQENNNLLQDNTLGESNVSDIAVILENEIKYTMKIPDEADYTDIPYLALDKNKKTFQFHICALSSYCNYGTYEIEDDILKAVTYDGKYHYQFRVTGEDSYIFRAEQSSALWEWDDKLKQITPELTDGAEFCRITNEPVPNEVTLDNDKQVVFDLDE